MAKNHEEKNETGNSKTEGSVSAQTEAEVKKGKIAKTVISGSNLTWNFADGTTVTYDVSKYPENVRENLLARGAQIVLRNVFADASKASDPIGVAKSTMETLHLALMSGELSSRGSVSNDFIEAMVVVFGKSAEECRERLADMSPAELEEYQKVKKTSKLFGSQLKRITAERLQKVAESATKDGETLEF